MRKPLFITFIIIALAVIVTSLWYFSRQPSPAQIARAFPNNSVQIFDLGKKVTVFALKPDGKIENAEEFHGYSVLGKTEIKDEDFQGLIKRAFLDSLLGGKEAAKCFNPRHGLRISDDKTSVDLVICFECKNFVSYVEGQQGEGEISNSAEILYNQILKDAERVASGK